MRRPFFLCKKMTDKDEHLLKVLATDGGLSILWPTQQTVENWTALRQRGLCKMESVMRITPTEAGIDFLRRREAETKHAHCSCNDEFPANADK